MPAPCPPSADPLVALADRCVQCGLCLPVCPTYRQDGMEPESPRGRIALARAWALDTVPVTPAGEAHLDHCLGCRACEGACPAGVRFGALLALARSRQRERRPASRRQRWLEALAARPRLLAALLRTYAWLATAVPPRLRPAPVPPPMDARDPALDRPASTTAPSPGGAHAPGHPTAGPPADDAGPVALFIGCAARAYESPARAALARLLEAAGIATVVPSGQGCCGSLHAHAGNATAAASLAGRNAAVFAGHRHVLTLASGCHEAVAAAMPAGTTAVDALQLLAAHADRPAFRPSRERVALHLPCTQRNVVRSDGALRRLLAAVPGLELVALDAGTGCCGASGTHFLLEPAQASAHRAPLLAQLHGSGATRLLSANLGCRLHLQGGTHLTVEHPVEFLARHLEAPRRRS
ncbi:MAG: (Fe-S)-binding protein [Pseudomonadota bacterium]